jgi:hypothetical protein
MGHRQAFRGVSAADDCDLAIQSRHDASFSLRPRLVRGAAEGCSSRHVKAKDNGVNSHKINSFGEYRVELRSGRPNSSADNGGATITLSAGGGSPEKIEEANKFSMSAQGDRQLAEGRRLRRNTQRTTSQGGRI